MNNTQIPSMKQLEILLQLISRDTPQSTQLETLFFLWPSPENSFAYQLTRCAVSQEALPKQRERAYEKLPGNCSLRAGGRNSFYDAATMACFLSSLEAISLSVSDMQEILNSHKT